MPSPVTLSHMARATNFFHGTKSEIPVGGLIVPGSELGNDHSTWGSTGESSGQPSRDHAFASTSWSTAKSFGERSRDWHDTGMNGHVYPVEPVGETRPGVHTQLNEHLATAWRVTGPPEHTKPVRKGEYRQGTLPVDMTEMASYDMYTARDEVRAARRRGASADEVLAAMAKSAKVEEVADRYLYGDGMEPAHKVRSRQWRKEGRIEEPRPKRSPTLKGQGRLW